jgi:O-antigen/teichoic acid export membrane protein
VFGISASAAWMLAYLLAGLVAAGGWLWWWARALPAAGHQGGAPQAEEGLRRRARGEGLQLFPATVAHSGTLRIDRLILVALASTAALGLYATVSTMVELLTWPLLMYADSRLGLWRQAHERGTLALRRVLIVAALYALVAAGVVTVVLRLILVPLLGGQYAAALPLILPLAIAAAVCGLSELFVNALTAVGRGRLTAVVEVAGLVVSVVAYVLLIERFGALGAAYGSLIGYTTCLALAGLLLVRVRRAPLPARTMPPMHDLPG